VILTYNVGIDLGTTNTAAAKHENGTADMIALGRNASEIPSVVWIQADGSVLTGEQAQAEAINDPTGVVRDFKWQLGDSVPKFVGNKPYTHEQIMSFFLRSVKSRIATAEGDVPAHVVIAYPALWGEFKQSKLSEAAKLAGLDMERVSFVTEPEAAALAYDAQADVKVGDLLAVYDLGGGGFDTCIVQRSNTGFSLIGRPERIDRLGGKRFDDVVYNHVINSLGEHGALVDDAPVEIISQIRHDCVVAKESLSNNPSARINVTLPGVQQEVLITRDEFHRSIEGDLRSTLDAVEAAVASAGVTPDDLSAILLVGGSSRIPIVNQLVTNRFGRPVAIDRLPNYTIALGASMVASGIPNPSGTTTIVKQLFNTTGSPEALLEPDGEQGQWWPSAQSTGSSPEQVEMPPARGNATKVVGYAPDLPPLGVQAVSQAQPELGIEEADRAESQPRLGDSSMAGQTPNPPLGYSAPPTPHQAGSGSNNEQRIRLLETGQIPRTIAEAPPMAGSPAALSADLASPPRQTRSVGRLWVNLLAIALLGAVVAVAILLAGMIGG